MWGRPGIEDSTLINSKAPNPGPASFALIIGGMKCGTTNLFELLGQHPEIARCTHKELDFFSKTEDPASAWDDYLSSWAWDPDIHSLALEASVSYAKAPQIAGVPERIASIPGARFLFIYMVRHPLRRIESQVRHGLFAGWGTSLDDGLPSDLVDFSRYATQLRHYRAFFPASAFMIVPLESFQADPSATLRKCCRFLEVNPSFDFRDVTHRRNSGDFFSVPKWISGVTRLPRMRAVAEHLPEPIKRRLRTTLGKRLGGRSELGRWQLNSAEEKALVEVLTPEVVSLRDEFGIDLTQLWEWPTEAQSESK